MKHYVYLFELRAIQDFLFNSGRLRDMILASELIDYVCQAPLDVVLSAAGADPGQPSPRRAGGAAYLVMSDQAQAVRVRQLWNLLLRQLLPGIELVDVIGEGDTVRSAVAQGIKALQVARNRPVPELPGATPLTRLAPRTGKAAVALDRQEPIDLATFTRRRATRTHGGLIERFGKTDLHWPDNFEEDAHRSRRFPLNSDRVVAMVHIDGNGIGELLRVINEASQNKDDQAYVSLYREFSEGLERTTCEAAQKATRDILIPAAVRGVIPARPLVLGGDDLSILIRSDLALPFAQAFASHYEQGSLDFIDELKNTLGDVQLPAKLTASGGIVYTKPGYPFAQAFVLSESLCGRAKKCGKRDTGEKVSAIALHRIQAAADDDADLLFKRERLIQIGDDDNNDDDAIEIALGLPAYGLTDDSKGLLPALSDLKALAEHCRDSALSKGRLRQLAGLFYQNVELAKQDYQRWRELCAKQEATNTAFKKMEKGLLNLVGTLQHDLPCSVTQPYQTALMDLVLLLDLMPAGGTASTTTGGVREHGAQ